MMGANGVTKSIGMGQPVRRVEDAAVSHRPRHLRRRHPACRPKVTPSSYCRRTRMPASAKSMPSAARQAPGVLCVLDRRGRQGRRARRTAAQLHARRHRRTQRPAHAPADPGARQGALRRRSRGDGGRRNARRRRATPPSFSTIDYEPLPAVVNIEDAVEPGAPNGLGRMPRQRVVHAHGRRREGDRGGIREGDASHLAAAREQPPGSERHGTARCPRPIRARRRQLHALHQFAGAARGAHAGRRPSSSACRRPSVRVIAPDVGGGFGVKADAYPEDALVLWAARKCGRPVKWIGTRSDALLGDNHGRDQVVHAELALDAAGQDSGDPRPCAACGRRVHRVCRGRAVALFVALCAGRLRRPARCGLRPRRSSPTRRRSGVYRGAGRPEGIYVAERLMNEAAAQIGLAPDEIRRKNFVAPEPDALCHRHRRGLRQRRVRAADGRMHGARRLEWLPRRGKHSRSATASCAVVR